MKKAEQIAKKYWEGQAPGAGFWTSGQRVFATVEWALPRIKNADSIVDIGCGSGEVTLAFAQFLNPKTFQLFDYNQSLLDSVSQKMNQLMPDIEVIALAGDIIEYPGEITADMGLLIGLTQYIFDDDKLRQLLQKLSVNQLIVRTPCTLLREDESIAKYSEALKVDYASKYRTVSNILGILEEFYEVPDAGRVFPDSIESKFGTKQFIFSCFRR